MTCITQPRMGWGAMLPVVATAAALAALLAFAPFASAATDPLAGGSTDLHLKKGFLKKLGNNNIRVLKANPGTVKNRTVGLPVNGGELDPTNGAGTVEQNGGLKLKKGNRTAAVTEILLDRTNKLVRAKVANARMKFGFLGNLSHVREGFGVDVKATKLKLTGKAARRISNKLGLKKGSRLKGGRVISNSYSATQPSSVTVLPQGSATLDGNIPTLLKFGGKGVAIPGAVSAIAPSTKPTPTSFEFPISGGSIAPDASAGTLQTDGGVQILKEAVGLSPKMQLLDIYVDFSAKTATVELDITPAPPFPGKVDRSSIADIVMTGATVVSDPVARTVTVTGAAANLQEVAAATLNDVFNQPPPPPPPITDFVAGDPFGLFSFTAQTQ